MAEKPAEWWYERAADCMVRDGKTLFWFSGMEDLGLTSKECDSIQRSKAFQEVLRARRNVFHKELVQDPTFTKVTVEGNLVALAQKLMEAGSYDKAANVYMQLAKLKGWTNEQTQVNILNDYSAADIAKLREKLQEKAKQQLPN